MDNNSVCFLFDMDGVVIDTEPQYDIYWRRVALQYNVKVANFEKIIKGITIPNIMNWFFSELSENQKEELLDDFNNFEQKVKFPYIPGAIEFIHELKSQNIPIGLVTSASELKVNRVINEKCFDTLFDTIVSAKDITNGKPAPDCFLLGANRLKAEPSNCIVFEDSFAGITAGNTAGMSVVGLATTHPKEDLKDMCKTVIPNFTHTTVDYILSEIK